MSFITRATHHLPAFARLYCNGPRPAERILRTAEKALKKLGGEKKTSPLDDCSMSDAAMEARLKYLEENGATWRIITQKEIQEADPVYYEQRMKGLKEITQFIKERL